MTKKQTTIRKIIAAITIVSLAILAIYAFSSSEKNEDANQNDPQKKIQNGDGPSAADMSSETNTAENDTWARLKSAWQQNSKERALGGFVGVSTFLWWYSRNLVRKHSNKTLLQYLSEDMPDHVILLVCSSILGFLAVKSVGYLIACYINKELSQSVINVLVVLGPSVILLQIGRLIYKRKKHLNNTNINNKHDNAIDALRKTLMLMKIGCLAGLAIGALTFTVVSYFKYYEGVDTADGIKQFFAKLNVGLKKPEVITVGVLSLIAAGVSSIVGEHDLMSLETVAILGAIIVGAVLTIQLVHTVATKAPGKCTILGALLWLGGYTVLFLSRKVPATWWDRKNIGSAVAMCFIGYLFDVYAKSWVDGLGYEIKGAKMNVVNNINVGLVVIDTGLILFADKANLAPMHGFIAFAVITTALYIGWYTYDGIAESVERFSKEHGKKGWKTLVLSLLFSSLLVAWATRGISGRYNLNNNRSIETNTSLHKTPNMSLINNWQEPALAGLFSVVPYCCIGWFTGYYNPISLKNSFLLVPLSMLSQLNIWHFYYIRKSEAIQARQLDEAGNKIIELRTELSKIINPSDQQQHNDSIIGLVRDLIGLLRLNDAKIKFLEKNTGHNDGQNGQSWAEILVDLLGHKKITTAIGDNNEYMMTMTKIRNTQVYLAKLVLSHMAKQLNTIYTKATDHSNPTLNFDILGETIGNLAKWLPATDNNDIVNGPEMVTTPWEEAASTYINENKTYARYIYKCLGKIEKLYQYTNDTAHNQLKDKVTNLKKTLNDLAKKIESPKGNQK